jgi:hypothetical protein
LAFDVMVCNAFNQDTLRYLLFLGFYYMQTVELSNEPVPTDFPAVLTIPKDPQEWESKLSLGDIANIDFSLEECREEEVMDAISSRVCCERV